MLIAFCFLLYFEVAQGCIYIFKVIVAMMLFIA